MTGRIRVVPLPDQRTLLVLDRMTALTEPDRMLDWLAARDWLAGNGIYALRFVDAIELDAAEPVPEPLPEWGCPQCDAAVAHARTARQP